MQKVTNEHGCKELRILHGKILLIVEIDIMENLLYFGKKYFRLFNTFDIIISIGKLLQFLNSAMNSVKLYFRN